MEPSSLRRTQTLQQFSSCLEPDLVFNDYLDNLSSCFSDSIFPLFVEHFKGIKNFTTSERSGACVQLLRILTDYLKKEASHIRSLDIKPLEYRGYLIDLLQTLSAVSDGKALDKRAILELIHYMVMAYPSSHEAFFSTLGTQLSVDRSWDQECFGFLYRRFVETPKPFEAHLEAESHYLSLFSNLYSIGREEFVIKYASYHLCKEPQTVSEYLDYLLVAAFRSKMLPTKKPPSPELAQAFIHIFKSSQFVNLSLDAALYHFKNSHIFFEFPCHVSYALFEGLLECANKELIVQIEVTTFDKAKRVKIYKPKTLNHFVSTRQLQDLFEAFVNPHLKWDREKFRAANKDNLVKLFQRNIRVEEEIFSEKVSSTEALFYEALVVKTKAFCEAYGLDTKQSIDHLNCELFAGTCARLQRAALVNRPLPLYCDPRELVLKQIKESLVNYKIVETIRHLFKQIQEIDPKIYERHKHRLDQKIRLLDQKKIRIGSAIYQIHFTMTELSIVKKESKKN